MNALAPDREELAWLFPNPGAVTATRVNLNAKSVSGASRSSTMSKLGSTVFRYYSLPSTNDLAREMAAAGAAEGVSVLALQQSEGRGRQGRKWFSPAGEGLYVSVITRPLIKPSEFSVITLAAAIAVTEVLKEEFGLAAQIKWPNDVLVDGKKICGILVESAIEGETIQYAVLGIGVNLSQRGFPADVDQAATSVFLELGYDVPLNQALKSILEKVDYWYQVSSHPPSEVVARWEQLSGHSKGTRVHIKSSDGAIEGITRGLTHTGALLVELKDGKIREIVAGEVTLLTPLGPSDGPQAER